MLIYLQMIESEEDKSKFEAIYNKYRYLMFSVANRVLNNQYDAEDAVHQAFLSIIDNLNKVREVDCPETRSYVVIITENKVWQMRWQSYLLDIGKCCFFVSIMATAHVRSRK